MAEYHVPGKTYVITIEDDGTAFCDCPAAYYGRGKACKHLVALQRDCPEMFLDKTSSIPAAAPRPVVALPDMQTLISKQWDYIDSYRKESGLDGNTKG